jgi:hypothetical protein
VRPFPPPELTWRPCESFLHVYALPDTARNPALAELAGRVRAVVAACGGAVMPVPDQWLHATIQMVTVPAAQLPRPLRGALARELAARLAGIPPLDLLAGPPLAGDGGVVLDVTAMDGTGNMTDAPWRLLRERVETAIGIAVGAQALRYEPGPPHISIGYAAAEADSGPVQAGLQRIRPGRARWRLDAVELVDVSQDAVAHCYTWRRVARIPLGRPVALGTDHTARTAAGAR